jgi:hypothetical protein
MTNSDLSMRNIVRALEALDSVLGGRDIPINVRTTYLGA